MPKNLISQTIKLISESNKPEHSSLAHKIILGLGKFNMCSTEIVQWPLDFPCGWQCSLLVIITQSGKWALMGRAPTFCKEGFLEH